MDFRRNPLHCIVPPYIFDHMMNSKDAAVRKIAAELMSEASQARAVRKMMALMPAMAAIPSPAGKKHRLVYDLKNMPLWALPGTLIRSEGEAASGDSAADEAYEHAGTVYDFYQSAYSRNSLDDRGMSLISSVHLRNKHNNAYWTGEQMAYGDGDGDAFISFTKALDVVAHEFSHGVVTHTCNLEYSFESGALNEHFADVFGILTGQWHAKQSAASATWLIGEGCMGPKTTAKSLRTFEAGLAYANDPYLGTDEQPKHMKNKYRGNDDYGGVHINSGIPNHAFCVAAKALGGNAWDRLGQIWYDALGRLKPSSVFDDVVRETIAAAADRYGASSDQNKAVVSGWQAVGLK